jgi:hypothetical protein
MLDVHELAAGKIAALFARHSVRDLFDSHQLLLKAKLDSGSLRAAFVAYGGMNRKDWREAPVEDLTFKTGEIRNQLVPVLRSSPLAKSTSSRRMGVVRRKMRMSSFSRTGILPPRTGRISDFSDERGMCRNGRDDG